MTTFNHYQNLRDKYLDGTIETAELEILKEHTRQCLECRRKLKEVDSMQVLLNESLAPESITAAKVQKKIQTIPAVHRSAEPLHFMTIWVAVAAGIVLVVGIFAGFELAQITKQSGHEVKAMLLPVKIDKLEGTVLVKHAGSTVWEELNSSSGIYLGDMFCSTAKSSLTLLPEVKSKIVLAANSTLVLEEFNGQTELRLAAGTLSADLASPHGPFFVSTPQGKIEALGTVFTVSVE
jgi:hypothetical protein